MQIFKYLFKFYIHSSLHIALSVWCLTQITFILNKVEPINYYGFLVFSGTLIAYNFLKYFSILYKNKFVNINQFLPIIITTLVMIMGFAYCFFKIASNIQIKLFAAAFLVFLYQFIRKIGWLKPIYVSMVITYITVFIPMNRLKFFANDLVISFFQQFVLLFCLMLPFEILDSKTDDENLKTLPQLFGIEACKTLGMLLTIPFTIVEFFKTNVSLMVLPVALIVVAFINFTSLKRGKYYTLFWVESVPILWYLLLVFVN